MMQPIWNKQELHLYKLAGGSLKKAKYFSFIKISIQLLSAKQLGLNETSPIKRNLSENDVFCIRVSFCDKICFCNAGKKPPTL